MCVIDAGMDFRHPAFKDAKYSSHGTHTTGIAVGSLSPQGFCGMAPDADIVYIVWGTPDIYTEGEEEQISLGEDSGSTQDPSLNTSEKITADDMETCLAFADAYAQTINQPMVLSASMGQHAGPHDGTGTVPEAISALSKHAIPVFAAGNEGGEVRHVQYEFTADKPSFSLMMSPSVNGDLQEEELNQDSIF